MLVVKIGGCNGSGKSCLIRSLLEITAAQPILNPTNPLKHTAYEAFYSGLRIFVLGSYQNVCGGMDTIPDKEDRLALIKEYADPKSNDVIIFEGLITGKTYGAIGMISEQPGHQGRWVYAFMDTPFEECVKRVLKRRKRAGNTTEFNPERTMRPTYKAVQSVRRMAIERDHWVYDIDHKFTAATSAEQLLEYIGDQHGN